MKNDYKRIWVTFKKEGIHKYPDAPENVKVHSVEWWETPKSRSIYYV